MHKDRGMYFEDFEAQKDEVYESAGRTITDADVVNFAGLSGDFNPLHMDAEYAKNDMFGKRVAHGMLGVVIMTGMSNQLGIFEGTTIAFLELKDTVYKAPLCIGDTVHLTLQATDFHKTKKPGRGIITYHAKLVNQEEKVITTSEWVLMMKTKEGEAE